MARSAEWDLRRVHSGHATLSGCKRHGAKWSTPRASTCRLLRTGGVSLPSPRSVKFRTRCSTAPTRREQQRLPRAKQTRRRWQRVCRASTHKLPSCRRLHHPFLWHDDVLVYGTHRIRGLLQCIRNLGCANQDSVKCRKLNASCAPGPHACV